MKQLLVLIISIFLILEKSNAQVGPIELMGGDHYLHYQHSLGQQLKAESKFGWQHIATLIKQYNTNTEKGGMPDELMNQAYLTFRLHSLLSLKGGLFYTNVGGYQPTIGIQFFLHRGDWVIVAAPRADLVKNRSYELFTMVEFSPTLTKNVKLYTRLQAMSNVSKEGHNRSYQLARVGVDLKGFQIGAGVTLDEYGTNRKVHVNSGVFVRKML